MAAHNTRKDARANPAARRQTIARNVARQVKQGRTVATKAGHVRNANTAR